MNNGIDLLTIFKTLAFPPLQKGGRGDSNAAQKNQSPSIPLLPRGRPTAAHGTAELTEPISGVKKAFWILALTLLCGSAWAANPFEQQLLNTIKQSVQEKVTGKSATSVEEETAIGRQIAGNLLGASPLVKNAKLQKYVNNVGRWVADQSERPELAWHFGVIESNDVNAFAAPGGYIFVTKGLYKLLQSEAELVGVLAHEIGHVIRQHHLKILQQGKLIDLGGQLVAKNVGGSDKVQGLIGSGAEIVSRSLDKGAEFEADRIAVVLATRAGYDAFGLPAVLQQIGHFAKDDGDVALLFKTHPHPDDRLGQLGNAMDDRFDSVKGKTLEKRLYRVK